MKKFNGVKEEKGSVTLFVLVSLLFLLIILFLNYSNQINKINTQKKEIEGINENYNVDEIIDQIYYQEESNMPIQIVLYKPSGDVYNLNEWTNQDLTLKIFYPEGLLENYRYYYLDGVKTKYIEGQQITKNCEIAVESEKYKKAIKITRIDKIPPTIECTIDGTSRSRFVFY